MKGLLHALVILIVFTLVLARIVPPQMEAQLVRQTLSGTTSTAKK